MLLHREEVIGVVLRILIGPLGLVAGGELALPAVLVLQDALHEIVHGGRLIDPGLDDALVALAGSIAGDLAQELCLIGGGGTRCLGGRSINGTVPVAGVLHSGVLLDDAEVQAIGGSVRGGEHSAIACAHDEDVGVHGLGDGGLIDVGLLAQPIGLVAGGQLDRGDGGLTLGLRKAALGSLHHSIRGNGGT